MRISLGKSDITISLLVAGLLGLGACAPQGDFPDIADVPPRPTVTETPAELEKEIAEMDAERVALQRRIAVIRREQNAEAVLYKE